MRKGRRAYDARYTLGCWVLINNQLRQWQRGHQLQQVESETYTVVSWARLVHTRLSRSQIPV